MSNLEGYIFGRYRLQESIGQGGMATVYKAHDTVNDRDVAIKVLSPAMAQNAQFSERFRREARVVMQLKHPHILPVLDVGEKDGYAYIVMPYMRSGSLAERLAMGSLTPHEAGRLVAQVSSALDHAHRQGIVHRDIKPPNIMLDEKNNAFLADFGLAHLHNTSISLTGSAIIGTPAYISPEQSLGRKVDARTDQYSLGIVLFQLATGQVPYNAETPIAILVKHVNEAMPTPRSVNPNVPEAVEKVILKATAKNPDDRFESIGEMNRMFQAALAFAVDPESNPEPHIELSDVLLASATTGDPAGAAAAVAREVPYGRRRVARLAAVAALLLLLLLACPVASTGMINFLNAASNPVEGMGLYEETMDPAELTALAGTIEVLSTEASAPTGVATVVQTVIVTDPPTATPTLGATPTITATGTITPTATATLVNLVPPTNPPIQPTKTNPPPPKPTKTPTKKPKTPTPIPTSTSPPPPTATPMPPPTNPPPTLPPYP